MLCLMRKVGERICIGEKITLCIVRVRDGRVTVGIEAPRHIQVLREELIKNPEDENPRAA